jgi:predicted ester cyclase
LAQAVLVTIVDRVGELLVAGDRLTELASYFDTDGFRSHGPDGFETDFSGTLDFFKALRAAFDNRSIRRGVITAEGRHVACQTWIDGTFVREFTHSPIGPIPPNGQRVTWDLINMFRFDDHGRLAEEWSRTDNRSLLRQLGAVGK